MNTVNTVTPSSSRSYAQTLIGRTRKRGSQCPQVFTRHVVGELLERSRNNLPGVGGSASRFRAKHQLVRCPQSHAGQVKPPNSLISQHPDQIVDWIWSLATGFSWAGTTGGVA